MSSPRRLDPTGMFRLDLPCVELSVSIARSAVRRVVRFDDADAESSFLVALTEVITNAIDEHRRIGTEAPIALEVEFGGVDVVRVIDAGRGLAPELVAESPRMDVERARGRGLALARAFVADLTFDIGAEGTKATLPLAGFGFVG